MKPLNAVQYRALQLLIAEPMGQASSARMGRLLGFAKGGHGPASAIMRALERRGLVTVYFHVHMINGHVTSGASNESYSEYCWR